MIRNISFLLIVVLISACGTLKNTQFSKRKHLNGHFWNLKGKYKSSNSNGNSEDYAVSRKEGDKIEKLERIPTTTVDLATESTPEESSTIEEQEQEERSFEIVEETELQKEQKTSLTKDENVTETTDDQGRNERPSQAEMTFAAIVIILIGLIFWFGVIGLVVTLFLKIFSTIIPWLFYTSLIIVGVFVLTFIGILIFFALES